MTVNSNQECTKQTTQDNQARKEEKTPITCRSRDDDALFMNHLHDYLCHDKKTIQECEKQLNDYLVKCGIFYEEGIKDLNRAEMIKKQREENYRNISSFLDRYRSLRRAFELFKNDFKDTLNFDTYEYLPQNVPLTDDTMFQVICSKLELMSVTDERRFLRTYAPQIEAGKKIEFVMKALDDGLKLLRAENESYYDIIYFTYIDGEQKPSIKELLSKLNFTSHSSYYQKINNAKKELTRTVFGYTANKAELTTILVYFRQQVEDTYFPDY